MEIIGYRSPGELIYRAMKHLFNEMSLIYNLNIYDGVSATPLLPAHSARSQAHHELASIHALLIEENQI